MMSLLKRTLQGNEMKLIGNVPESFFTHKFLFGNKECLVGKFDPEQPTVLLDVPLEHLGTELMLQIDASGVFTLNELENIAMMSGESFLANIIEL